MNEKLVCIVMRRKRDSEGWQLALSGGAGRTVHQARSQAGGVLRASTPGSQCRDLALFLLPAVYFVQRVVVQGVLLEVQLLGSSCNNCLLFPLVP